MAATRTDRHAVWDEHTLVSVMVQEITALLVDQAYPHSEPIPGEIQQYNPTPVPLK